MLSYYSLVNKKCVSSSTTEDVMLCYVMLCYVMLCYVMLCYVMFRYVTLRYAAFTLEHDLLRSPRLTNRN